MWYYTKGINHIRIEGPTPGEANGRPDEKVYRLCAWIEKHPEPGSQPDFYAELDKTALINLRNALSAAILAETGMQGF